MLSTAAAEREVSKFHWTTGQVQDVTPIPLRTPKYRANRTEPLMFSPVDPHVLYYATNVLFKTTNGGNSWQTISKDLTRENPGAPASVGTLMNKGMEKQRGVIYALAPSFKELNTLWAGTDDGLIWITHDGGKNWNDITPKELTPWSKVTQISASHFDEQTAYASVSRFRINDMHPYIYRTRDGGKTWTLDHRRACRTSAPSIPCAKIPCARVCCSPERRTPSGSRSTMAITGSRCN